MVITRTKNGSPDMILTPFDGKFYEKKHELPPGSCRPPNKVKKTMSKKWVHIRPYTSIYLQIPSYSSK